MSSNMEPTSDQDQARAAAEPSAEPAAERDGQPDAQQSSGVSSDSVDKSIEAVKEKLPVMFDNFQARSRSALSRITTEMRKPAKGAAIAGVVALGAAVTLGFAETVLGMGVAFVAYRVLREQHRQTHP